MTKAPADRQILAQAQTCDIMPFARALPLGDDLRVSIAAPLAVCDFPKEFLSRGPCDSFPLTWPSPTRVGPFFRKRVLQNTSLQATKTFVESATITTNFRGRLCGNLWFLAFWPCHFRLVWTMTSSAAYWARAWVRRLPRPRGATSIRAQFWAACSARCATTLTSAASATKPLSAFGPSSTIRPNGQPARLAFFAFLSRGLAPSRHYQELAHV